jgi:5'-nucleotidase
MEAAIEGVPSIGFSSVDHSFNADFTVAKIVARDLAQRMLATKMPDHILLNVNVPITTPEKFKGIKICRQAYSKWAEEFEKRIDPRGRDYFWMTGKFLNLDKGANTDVEALEQGFASVVPVTIDFTDYKAQKHLQDIWGC